MNESPVDPFGLVVAWSHTDLETIKIMMTRSPYNQHWMRRITFTLAVIATVITLAGATAVTRADVTASTPSTDASDYLVGGPLAGMKLPLYPTYHGEPAGRPGNSGNTVQLQLYPGSVEHWRAYMGKYMPIRSFFDQQSMVQRWIAPNLPGLSDSGAQGQYAQPLYKVSTAGEPQRTGQFEPPVDIVTFKAGDTIAQGSTGGLEPGLYCVRIVAAVPQEELIDFRDDLFIQLAIDDKLDGGVSNYRLRAGYCDQFYSLVEFYFHAPTARDFNFRLSMDPASKVTLMVREVLIDDALAGIQQRAIKSRSNAPLQPQAVAAYRKDEPQWAPDSPGRQARLDRDAQLWHGFPQPNKPWVFFFHRSDQGDMSKRVRPGALGKDITSLDQTHGAWKTMGQGSPVMLRNDQLDLDYTWTDFHAGRPLPLPYPIQDDGNGVAARDADSRHTGQCFFEVAKASTDRLIDYQRDISRTAGYLAGRSPRTQLVRDNLIKFVRFAYEYPTYDTFNALDGLITQNGPYNRQFRNFRRDTPPWFLSWYTEYLTYNALYDELFPLIQGNEELAQSVSRFIPQVKNAQDLVMLFDAYLVQHTAKKIMRYHYHTYPSGLTQLAAILGDQSFTQPWMDWQFTRSWAYPLALAGVQHYMISGMDRSGVGRGGTSSYYATSKMAYLYAQDMEAYEQAVGHTDYSLLDPRKYPKVFASLEWPIELHFAGIQYLRTGDVSGPEKPVGHLIPTQLDISRAAWRWTRDARHAKILATFDKPKAHAPDDWAAILAAAATQKRLPYYDQRSRYLPNWGGFLETGQQHDELSFRRGLAVRTGLNFGHAHEDSLDLQVAAHGLPLVLDAGQRPGYTQPPSQVVQVHNTVTYNGQGGLDHAWVRTIADNPGVQYLLAQRGEPTGPNRGSRQLALIDVDEGLKTTSTDASGKQTTVIQRTPNSYVMDVFRVDVGQTHQYNFHAMVNDQFEWNAQEVRNPGKEHKFLGTAFPAHEDNLVGVTPETFTATWRMQKEADDTSTNGFEQNLLQAGYDPDSPHKFLRLHMLDTQGMTVERAQLQTHKPAKNQMTMIGVIHKPAARNRGSAFINIIEPFAGQPIITSTRSLHVKDNELDARRAVAIHVKTVNHHDDLLMADGRPEKIRELEGGVSFAGEFALLSLDDQGLRLASITGGTLLHGPGIRMSVQRRALEGHVVQVDYREKKIVIDQPWPARNSRQLVEIGHDRKMTSYTMTAIQPQGNQTELTALRGADFMSSPIARMMITPAKKTAASAKVTTTDTPATAEVAEASDGNAEDEQPEESDTTPLPAVVGPVTNRIIASLGLVPKPGVGRRVGWVVSNGDATRFWRADVAGNTYTLEGDVPISESDFAPTREVRLWEYGVGDKVTQRTTASISRLAHQTYRVQATDDITLSLPGSTLELSRDGGQSWFESGQASEGWVTIRLSADQTAEASLWLRVR